MKKREHKRTVGRRELVDFPHLGLLGIEAKVDTGAFTSAIHCSNIHEYTRPDGSRAICFELLDESHPQYDHRKFEFTEFTLRDIKNSFGDVQERYIIKTVIELFGREFEAEFSLSDRSDMKYPVLIGRSLLSQGRLVVDVAKKNLSYKFKQKQEQKKNIL